MRYLFNKLALKVSLIYVAVGALWIVLSDAALQSWLRAPEAITRYQTHKGWLFVAVTGALLYALIAFGVRRLVAETRARRASEQRLRTLLDTAPHGIEELDLDGVITYSNPAHHEILGYEQGELLGMPVWDLMPTEREQDDLRRLLRELAARPRQGPGRFEGRNRRKDGALVEVQVDWDYRYDEGGALAGFVSVITDVSERRRAERELRLAATVFESSAEGVVITDPDTRILTVNRAFEDITGYPEAEVVGRTPAILQSGYHDHAFYQALWEELRSEDHWEGEIWNRRSDGESYAEWLSISAVRDDAGELTHYVGVFTDLSRLKESEHRLERLTHRDPLTGLPNRLLFGERLEHGLERAAARGYRVAVLMLDLDRFRTINDMFGHDFGDKLLREAAARVGRLVQPGETFARPGGDEFMFLFENEQALRRAGQFAAEAVDLLSAPFTIGGDEVFSGASIGIAVYPKDARDGPTLIKNAEAAMYRAKEGGGGGYEFFTGALADSLQERFRLERALRRALELGRLSLHYQPQLDLKRNAVTGMEALLRWDDPELGPVSPAVFIPLAEELGLIDAIGAWVLEEACRQAVQWREQGLPDVCMAVNVSAHQVTRDGFPAEVAAVLARTGLAADRLELEVTETALMENAERAAANIKALAEMRVSIAIDDFGTGYSSLSYLKRFALDKLKIDRSFVTDVPGDSHDEAIIDAIIALADSLKVTVIAEGVETEEQRRFLIGRGCQQYQGFLSYRPAPAEAIAAALSAQGAT